MLLLAVQRGPHQEPHPLGVKPQTSRGVLPASLPQTAPRLLAAALAPPPRPALLSSLLGALLNALLYQNQ